MSKQTKISNVPIRDLRALLAQLGENYQFVDVIMDPENRTLILDPVEEDVLHDTELTDQNIYDII
jgi:hypothetical protein